MPAIALQSIRVRARIEEHGAGFTVPMRRDRQAQPMVGRTERLACEFGHPQGQSSDKPATTCGIPTSGWPRADFDPCEAPKIQWRVCLRRKRKLSVLYFPIFRVPELGRSSRSVLPFG